MTNVALSWPNIKCRDMTSPAEIEQMARAIADLPNLEARRPLVEQYRAEHSDHVMKLVRKRARELLQRGKRYAG